MATEGTEPAPLPLSEGTQVVNEAQEATQQEDVPSGEETYNVNVECFRTMEELRKKHEEFYKEMIKHIATSIINEMKKMPEKIKRAQRSGGA